MVKILGINAYHADAAASLIIDGKIINSTEEERFTRIKHCAGFPLKSIDWCLKDANIQLKDLDHISINTNPKAHILRKFAYVIRRKPNPFFIFDRFINKIERGNLKEVFKQSFGNQIISAKFHFVEHHKCHLASAFFASSFNNALVISVDGFGDFASCAVGIGNKNKLSVLDYVFFPHSLGAYYTAMTQFLGFPNYGDEYKVMGLAPYGNPKYMNEMREIVNLRRNGKYQLNLKYFNHATKRIPNQWSQGYPILGKHYSDKLINLLGKDRSPNETINQFHKDIAASVQLMYEESFFNLLNYFYRKYPQKNICIAGGCGANSVANGKITKRTQFSKVFIQAAAGDAGGALGSAMTIWHDLSNQRIKPMGPSYLGQKFSDKNVSDFFSSKNIINQLSKLNSKLLKLGDEGLEDEKSFLELVVNFIEKGAVVGWFEGRMEWGPRALGHRSILCDPRRSDMKKILNLKIKKRESFRPFAPSVLKEFAKDWFDFGSEEEEEVPYMMKVLPIKNEKRHLIPAVCHVDGTGRLQTVTEKENGRYYKLIKCFHAKTNIPMLLNTSFNENEPIVCNLSEAFDCFKRTNMDMLVIEKYVITRNL